VRKLQALKNIISKPSAYGIELDPIPNEPYFTVLIEPPELDVALAARLAEMPVNAFMALNPGFSRSLIRSSAATRIVLPSDRVGVFHHNLAKHGSSLVSWQAYHPQRGETLGTIAKRFELSVAELKRVNGIPAASWRLPETLVVPLESGASTGGTKLPISSVHHVKPGDTLSAIAGRYRVRLADLKRWNPAAGVLQVGQKIYIRSP
jgi:membrane-bound lytic murein transglycosylase D